MRGISLTRETQETVFVKNRGDAFRLRVTAHDAVAMPEAIFLHRRKPPDPYKDAASCEEFIAIVSPFDATIYPADVPDPTQVPPFYRKTVFDILLPSQEATDDVWAAVVGQVNELIRAYNRLDVLGPGTTVRLGDDLEGSVSESESGSVSESSSES